jgi:PncC family amidohydrolase
MTGRLFIVRRVPEHARMCAVMCCHWPVKAASCPIVNIDLYTEWGNMPWLRGLEGTQGMSTHCAERVAAALLERQQTLAVAESSTGGLILSLLTDVAGASVWLRGGVVAYTNDSKRSLLNVPEEVLSVHGAVSADAALAMARGVRYLFGTTWALGETGVAGPQTGRRSAKPAGLTFIAVSGGTGGTPLERSRQILLPDPGDRITVKHAFADAALTLLLEILQDPATS